MVDEDIGHGQHKTQIHSAYTQINPPKYTLPGHPHLLQCSQFCSVVSRFYLFLENLGADQYGCHYSIGCNSAFLES